MSRSLRIRSSSCRSWYCSNTTRTSDSQLPKSICTHPSGSPRKEKYRQHKSCDDAERRRATQASRSTSPFHTRRYSSTPMREGSQSSDSVHRFLKPYNCIHPILAPRPGRRISYNRLYSCHLYKGSLGGFCTLMSVQSKNTTEEGGYGAAGGFCTLMAVRSKEHNRGGGRLRRLPGASAH